MSFYYTNRARALTNELKRYKDFDILSYGNLMRKLIMCFIL